MSKVKERVVVILAQTLPAVASGQAPAAPEVGPIRRFETSGPAYVEDFADHHQYKSWVSL